MPLSRPAEPMPADASNHCSVTILGEVGAIVDGSDVPVTSHRLRALLAGLAVSADATVSFDRLAEIVWGEDFPGNVRRSLQTYLSRLRAALGTGRVLTSSSGARLRVDPEDVDALRFERLLDRAAAAGDGEAYPLLEEALGLWRGEPFTGLESRLLLETEAPRLVERRLAAIERLVDLDLAAGRAGSRIAELRALAAAYPLRESLWTRLVLALSATGRGAEALEAYETVRTRLAEELGADPGADLQRLHRELLTEGAEPPPAPQSAPRPVPVPRQLPMDVDHFVGRIDELKELEALVAAPSGRGSKVAVVTGMAGVGKTSLVVHFAHRAAPRFPDGQLYIDLAGFGPRPPVGTDEAVRRLLDAFAVPPEHVPEDLDARAGLYRSITAGKRLLVVLDNAADPEHVRALLPGGPGCFTLVASRDRLGGLVAATAAHPLPVEPVPPADARQMFMRRIGPDRAARERAAFDVLVQRCSGLPLALAVASARAATAAHLPLSDLTATLSSPVGVLDGLAGHGPDLRAVFSWSYRGLGEDAARLFRSLGTVPGAELTAEAAASLAGLTVAQAEAALGELARASLAAERPGGRITLHDLLCAYAATLAEECDDDAGIAAAIGRLCDHYAHTAHRADALLDPQRDPIALPEPAVPVRELPDRDAALAWFAHERHTLARLVRLAADRGFDRRCWRLAWAMTTYLDLSSLWEDWAATQRLAAAAAAREGEPAQVALSRRLLGRALVRMDRLGEATGQFLSALDHYAIAPDPVGEAMTYINLGWLEETRLDFQAALRHNRCALDRFEAAGHVVGQSRALNALGWDHLRLGKFEPARELCETALELQIRLGDRRGEAETFDSLAHVHHGLGAHAEAEAHLARAIGIFREVGDRYNEADLYGTLAGFREGWGDADGARIARDRAAALLEAIEHAGAPEAGEGSQGSGS
ncbi:BTAD domain-containing putative transcriptional regulator [Glycomyces scopariae]